MKLILLFSVLVAAISESVSADQPIARANFIRDETITQLSVVRTFPHDGKAFTQGFEIHDGMFYESTGLYGRSSIRIVDPETGNVEKQFDLASQYFAEGMTEWNNTLYQLTWKLGKAFIYDRVTLEPIGEFTYPTQGWGLTHNDEDFIMSDGTNNLYFRDAQTFEEKRRVVVNHEGRTIRNLNELELINGFVFANIWYDTRIAIIDPSTGDVLGFVDCQELKRLEPLGDVLNGIAYDAPNNRLFVTGKLWNNVYELEMPDLSMF